MAAKQLDLAQPTVSQHIRKLEEALGTKLVDRNHARSRPTREGLNALPLAKSLLKTAERMTLAVGGDSFVIGASNNIASYFLPRALGLFEKHTTSKQRWQIVQAENPFLIDKLRRGEIDIALTEWQPDQTDISSLLWRKEQLVVIVPPNHQLAARKSLRWDDLVQLPLIGGERGTGTGALLRDHFGKDADQLMITSSMGSTEAVKNAVISGLGCSIVLHGSVRSEAKGGQLALLRIQNANLEKSFFVSSRMDDDRHSRSNEIKRFLAASEI